MNTKRAEIIEATSHLMSAKGYADTSLSDILTAAQIGKGQFYHYFPSKHELGLAVVAQCTAWFEKHLFQEILESPQAAEAKLNTMFDWLVAFHQKRTPGRGCFFGNMALEMSEHDEAFRLKLRHVFETWSHKIENVLHNMFQSRNVPPDDIRRLALTIVAMLEGGFLIMKNYRNLDVLRDIIKSILLLLDTYKQKYPQT